jgi:uncharacterized membrane protein YsdA (DUF1294 family)
MPKHDPKRFYLVIAIILIAIASGLLWWRRVPPLYAYLVCINIIVFLFYGYDKRQSRNNKARIPEITLHLLALLGGSPGALLGQLLFRHKTRKLRFKIVFLGILFIQAGLGFCYWRYWR